VAATWGRAGPATTSRGRGRGRARLASWRQDEQGRSRAGEEQGHREELVRLQRMDLAVRSK
jgi:hypothetical protein